MQISKIRIPGKVMLSGEYAVLYGAKSVLIPTPRYLELSEVTAPPEIPYSKVVDTALKYPIPQIEEYESKAGIPHIKIDNREFYASDNESKSIKLGLGGSAAEAVGVVSLRYERAGLKRADYSDDIFKHAFSIHKQAQSGLGSGADVALCSYGKPLKFSILKQSHQIEFINLKKTKNYIPLHLVWTGLPADTRKLVSRFQNRFADSNEDTLNQLINISNRLAESWFVSPRNELFDLINEFNEIMRECAAIAGIPYRLPIHDELEVWAKNHGGRAKPTGAGGGDMILLVGDLPIDQLKQLIIPLRV